MGVNQLWNILEPVRKKENLSALRNKTLCVDLSCWICEAQCAKGLKQSVSKPHLRNLFFRLLHLTRLGVKLVFVVDGKPPELKWDAIAKRIQTRNGGQNWRSKNSQKTGSGARVGRSHFATLVRECHTLLSLLGVPCLESAGEAEALCAWLNLHQIVDGCITNDGDAFLYGARTVYKDLCISGKDASVERYKMEDIESQLNLNRHKLVALGILLGCDYLPQGVSGVGKEIAMKLIRNFKHDSLIDRFYEWTKGTIQDENISSIEKSVKCKALKDKNFPHPEVIQEFLAPKVVPQQVSLKIMRPDLLGLQEFCLKNLEWPGEYTREKVLLLITYWQMTSSLQHHTTTLVQPERIVKARIQQKVECYEVEWQNVELGETCPFSFVTVEPRELFNQVYPDLVEEFNNAKAAKLSKKSKKKKADKPSTSNSCENEMDLLSQQLKDLSVHQISEQCHDSAVQYQKPDDDSLQDIIDSILPSTRENQSCSLERCSPIVSMGDENRYFFAAGITGGDIDYSPVSNGDNDSDDDDIPCDFKALKVDVMAANFEHKEECKSDNDNDYCPDSKKCEAVKVNPNLLESCDQVKFDYGSYSAGPGKPVMSQYAIMEAELKSFSSRESVVVVESSDDDDDDDDDEVDNDYGEKSIQKRRLKAPKAKRLLNDSDLNEIFGCSDLWSSDSEDEEVKDSRNHGKPLVMKPSCIAKSKAATHSTKLFPRKSMHDANSHLSPDTDVINSSTAQFEKNGGKQVIHKGPLTNVLQDVSSAKLNKLLHENEHHKTGKDGKLCESPAEATSHRSSCSSLVHHFINDSQVTQGQSNSTGDVDICGSSQNLQHQGSQKENVASPLIDDYMPAPLFKRLGKNFSAKQRLDSLRSISSATDDI